MATVQTRPEPKAAPATQSLEEAQLGWSGKTCAAGAGVVGAVCCGGGAAAVAATAVGALGAVGFMRTWFSMQGLTLISASFAVLVVLGLTLLVTRRARAGLPPEGRRRVYLRSLTSLGGWALAGYFAWVVIGGIVLQLIGFKYPGSM